MNQPLPSKDTIWIGTVDEVAERSAEGRPIAADIESLDVAIESAIFAIKGSKIPIASFWVLIQVHVQDLLGSRMVFSSIRNRPNRLMRALN